MKDYLNAEGYWDGTACSAIRAVTREEERKQIMNSVKRGDVWEIETAQGSYREVIVINVFESYAAILTIVETEPKQNAAEVRGRSAGYTDCGRLGYAYYDKFSQFIRQLSDEDLNTLLSRISTALDLTPVYEDIPELTDGEAEDETAEQEVQPETEDASEDEATRDMADLSEVQAAMNIGEIKGERDMADLSEVQAAMNIGEIKGERDLYKTVYQDLIELLGAAISARKEA